MLPKWLWYDHSLPVVDQTNIRQSPTCNLTRVADPGAKLPTIRAMRETGRLP